MAALASLSEVARDELAHDFGRPAVDPLHPSIGIEAADLVLAHEAITAEELQALVDQGPSHLKFGLEVGEFVARVLEIDHWAPEHLARSGVFTGDVECLLRRRHRRDPQRESFLRQLLHQRCEARALRTEQVLHGHLDAVKKELGRIRRKMPELLQVASAREAWAVRLDQYKA